jgi:hypothetical protein
LPVRFTDREAAQDAGAQACVAHRCDDHAEIPPVNDKGPQRSECGMCVADTIVATYEATFEKNVFWPLIESARTRLNLLAPGAGDSFLEEARATLNAASIDDGSLEKS